MRSINFNATKIIGFISYLQILEFALTDLIIIDSNSN